MARKLRVEYAGACYHVINRGNYRRDLFGANGAAASFQHCLFEACERFGWRLHAFVVMRNHFHLAVETPEPNLSEGMKWLQCTWATRFNRFHAEVGHPFQGRYKGIHVESGPTLARVANYIHLNPVCAGLVTAERLRDYRWSSLPLFLSRHRPIWLAVASVLRESGGWADTEAGRRCYRMYLELLAAEDPKTRDQKLTELSRGWAIGSSRFLEGLQEKLVTQTGAAGRFALLGADHEAHLQARAEVWEERVQAVARALAIDLTGLPARKSAPKKLLIAAMMKRITSVLNRWLATRLQMGEPTSVAPLLHRFALRGGSRTTQFRAALSRISV